MRIASWSLFVGVRGWSVRAVVGRLWVEVWALLIACDRLVAGMLLSVWSWSWLEPLLVGWGAWLVTWRCRVWGQVGCCRG